MEDQKNVLTVPIAIVVAGIIIAGAVFLSRGGPVPSVFDNTKATAPAPAEARTLGLRAVNPSDHILGNPSANVVMVEFSDLECPFCKNFHGTLQALIDKYGKSGQVAWVYRHFPLSIHPRSPKESEASECAFEQGGNDKFWAYINKIFSITPANNGLNPEMLPQVAVGLGLDKIKFQTCLDGGKFAEKIQNDYDDGLAAGVNGTPNTILILQTPLTTTAEKRILAINTSIMQQMQPGSPNIITIDPAKKKVGISGALPASMMNEIVDLLVSGK